MGFTHTMKINQLLMAGFMTLPLGASAADLVFNNALVWADDPQAEAVVVDRGKIVFVGSNAGASEYIEPNTQLVDLNGKMLLPGFIDNHTHLGEGGEVTCMPDDELTIEQQRATLATCADGVPAGEWIIGYGMYLDHVLGDGTSNKTPKSSLDSIFPNNPVIIMEQTSHAMFVNSAALSLVGMDKRTPDPQGGKIMKDARGEVNGVLVDNAGDLAMGIAVNSLKNRDALLNDGILYGLEEAAKHGITTVGDGRTYWKRGMYEAWKAVAENNELTARVSVRPWIYPTVSMEEQLVFLDKAYQPDTTQLLIVNQVKMYSDGVPENGTARMIEPYAETWFPESPYGINYIPFDQMQNWLSSLNVLGYGAHIHALGDRGIREALNAVASVRKEGSSRQYNITHLSMMDRADIPRFAELNVDADMQVGEARHTHEQHMADYQGLITRERAQALTYRPLKALSEQGANVVLSSDWTVNPLSPLAGIAHAVDEKSLTLEQAIDAYTINAAHALGLEKITGSIEVGKSADFVVLAEDISQLSPQDILTTKTLMTYLQGERVFDADVYIEHDPSPAW